MSARPIDGKAVAAQVRGQVRRDAMEAARLVGRRPCLAAVLVGDDPASAVYVRSKERACGKAEIDGVVHRLPADSSQETVAALLDRLGADEGIDGILLQLPLPAGLDGDALLERIDPDKDVDGLHPRNLGLLAAGRPGLVPCTPAGVMTLLRESGIATAGADACILGRSRLVGIPLALLLAARGSDATVTVCHSRTADLAEHTRRADILVAAIGRPEFVTADMVKPGATVVDVGINRLADGSLVGDVAFGSVREVAGALTPVPGGVGPMTIAELLRNTVAACRRRSR